MQLVSRSFFKTVSQLYPFVLPALKILISFDIKTAPKRNSFPGLFTDQALSN